MGRGSCVAEIVDDGWEEQADAVERADDAPVHEEAEIELPVCQSADDELPLEMVRLGDQAAGIERALVF